MISQQLEQKIRKYVKILQRYVDRIWYPPLVGLLAMLDNFVVVIPNDGILISSAMIIPKRWFSLALCIAIGSAIGALTLAVLVELKGLPWILEVYPGLDTTQTWTYSMNFFEKYGLLLVFAVAITPLVQQPAVILASLAKTPLLELVAVIFIGRFIKYLIMAYAGAFAPKLLAKMWGVKGELKEVGVEVKSQ